MKPRFLFRTSLLLALCSLSGLCLAAIQVGGTRVVFPATDHEASIQVRNEGTEDIMIQSWIEAAPGQSESDLPFAITPSLARLGHKKQQMLRIFYQGKGLPEDRERPMVRPGRLFAFEPKCVGCQIIDDLRADLDHRSAGQIAADDVLNFDDGLIERRATL